MRDPQRRMHARPRQGRFDSAADAVADILSRDDLAEWAAGSNIIVHDHDCVIGGASDPDMDACSCHPTIIARPQSRRLQ